MSVLLLALLMMGAYAKEPAATIKVVDIRDVTTVVTRASSSSSSSCHSPDFPVLRGGSYRDVNFNELSRIIVHHDQQVKDAANYIGIELVAKDGKAEVLEMIKHIRFTGNTKNGEFSIMVKDIKTVEVIE